MADEFMRDHDGHAGSADRQNATSGNSTQTSAAGSDIAVGQAGAAVMVDRPAPGQRVEIQTAPDQTYILNFPPAQAQVEMQGDDFVLGFDDNGDGATDSRIVFLDLVDRVEAGEAPTFQIAGVAVGGEVLLRQALALAGEEGPPLDDVAAGPAAPGGGATAYSDNLGDVLDLLTAQGVIPPVALEFGLIELEEEILFLEEGNAPPLADPVLAPAEQGDLPPALADALADLGLGASGAIPAGWTALGGVGTTDSSFGIAPPQGSAQLTLTASGADDASIEAFFGLPVGTFDALPGIDEATDGSAIKTMLAVLAGDTVTFHIDFLDLEQYDGNAGYNDFAFVVFGSEVVKLADVLSTDSGPVETAIGTVARTGYNEFTVTFTSAGDFVFGFGVMNEDDTSVDSALLVDNVVHGSGEMETLLTGFEGEVVFFKQLAVDGAIDDDDSGAVADFGGADVETPLGDLVFTLQGAPTYGQLILVTSGGATSFLNPGDSFSSADTVWWIATQEQIDDFLSGEGAPEFLPAVEFPYSVTDAEGASATAPVTITLPPPSPPETTLQVEQGDCLNEDTQGALLFTAAPTDSISKISQIVMSGFPTGAADEAWSVDAGSVNLFGLTSGVDFTASYDAATGALTVDLLTTSLSPGETVQGTVGVVPNPDNDLDRSLTIEATAVNVAGSAVGQSDSIIVVDADADGGEGSSSDDGDGIHLSIATSIADATGEEPENGTFQADETGTLSIVASFDDFLDGSETHSIQVFAPAGFTILEIGPGSLPPGVSLVSNDGSIALFDVETTNGVGSVGFDLQVSNTGAESGGAGFLVRALAEETTTPAVVEGDVECVDGGEGGLNPIAGDNVAFVEAVATATVADLSPPEVVLSLPDQVDCIAEDSTTADASNVVNLTVTPVGDDEITEIVISGLQAGWSYDFSGLETDGATLTDGDASDGSIVLSVPSLAGYSGSFAVAPPADSDVDHPTITASATVVDPVDPALSASGEGTLDISVDAVADPVTVDIIVNDSGEPAGSFSANETGTVRVVASVGDIDDDSENHTITVVIPAAFAIAALVGLPAGVTAETVDGGGAGDEVVFTIGSGVGSLDYTFEVTAPETVSDEDSFVFQATAQAVETNTGDIECSADNNLAAASDEQTVPGFAAAPALIVGENVDDIDGETTPHRVHFPAADEDSGAILGDDVGDVLIGDVGGSSLAGNIMNLVMVLDTSNSMEAEITFNGVPMSRIEALDLALEQLLDGIAGTEGATVRVHLVSFATDVKEVGTFDIVAGGVVDGAALQAAKDFVIAAGDSPTTVASGNTNYEAGFTAALDWFSDDGNTLDNPAFNQTIFISDGLPNRAYRGDGTTNVIAPGAQVAVDHVLGQVDMDGTVNDDTISEFAGLLGPFKGVAGTVDAIGINVGPVALDRLHQLDGNSASSIDTGEQLLAALSDLTKLQLAAVGGDVITGADGDDVIFGDTIFTDSLAADEGLLLPAGSGWSVIEALVGGGFFDSDPSKSVEEEIMDFLRAPANQAAYDFGTESVISGSPRADGSDRIDGGGGNDLIFGQEGDDTIIGGTGDDTLAGGSGADAFTWGAETSAGEADIIVGFEAGPGGDLLDFSTLLTGVAPGDDGDELDAYLQFGFDGTDTTIGIDANGDGSGFTDVTVTLQDEDLTGGSAVQADIIDSLLSDGNLQVV